MTRTQLVRLKLKETRREQADALRREAGRAWSEMLTFHWRVYRKKGRWLSKFALQRWARGRYALHSQSIQALADKLHANFETARQLRRGGDGAARFPYKRKDFQVVVWKGQAMRVRGGRVVLPNGRGRPCFSVRLPAHLRAAPLRQAELVWRNGEYWLACAVDRPAEQPGSGERLAAVDMGEVQAMALTDGEEALVISGRASRSVKRWRNKRLGDLARLLSRCQGGSRRSRKLQRAKNRVKARAQRRLRDLDHQASRLAVNWLLARSCGTVVMGELRNIANGQRLPRVSQQKVSQWQRGRQERYIEYKFSAQGGKVVYRSERGTSSTCPRCGRHVHPHGRVFQCGCGFVGHRDVVGASGILGLAEKGQVHGARVPTVVKYRLPAEFRRGRRSPADTGPSGLGHVPNATTGPPPQESHAF